MTRGVVFGCLAFSALLHMPLANADPLVIGNDPWYRLGGHLEILRDDTRKLTLTQVTSSSASWRPTADDEPNPGFSAAAYWVRFQLESRTAHRLLLAFDFANVDMVNVFIVQPGGVQEMASGTHIPFDERSIPYRYPLFPVTLQAGPPVWCYVQVRNMVPVFPLTVWDEATFHRADHDWQLLIGVFIGLFLIVTLFNTLFFIATRDRAYLYYVLFVLSYLLFELAFRGFAGEYLWPMHTRIDNWVEVVAASLAITTASLFARSFLQTRTWAPFMHRFLGVIIVLGAMSTLCSIVFPFRVMVQVSNGLLLLVTIVLIVNAAAVFRRGFRAARFYLAAWIMLLPSAFIFGLFNLGLAPSNLLTRTAMSIGMSLEITLLFLANIDRYLLLQREGETSQRERLEAVQKRLYSDTLTEFPNRNRLMADLPSAKPVTMILVNIDHFKEINDSFGQQAGDLIIKELGNRVRASVAAHGGTVYRLHADEFAAVLDSPYDEEALTTIGRTLVAHCQHQPYLYENETLRLDVGVGIVVTDARHLEKADMALSVARAKKTLVIYRPELEVIKRYADNLRWLHTIREAIEQDRILPFFQPIMNNASGSIDKFEALMRIRMPDGEVIAPGAFLSVAKKSKIYPELSQVIIEKTAAVLQKERREVSINISMEDILHPDVRAVMDRLVSETGIGKRIVFELLESEGIENYDEVSRFIEAMKERGCKIAIDDFGAGYSNFEHILRLRVDYLKLDASLIKPIDNDANARSIVETIVSFAQKLGIQTIAEFVHNEVVQSTVRAIGVDHSQGYFIGQPRSSTQEVKT